MSTSQPPHPYVYGGLFLVTLATLMHEILLPRIFSVTMYYHFAFMAISIAMFGITVGGIVVYLKPATFTVKNASRQLAFNALAYALGTVASFVVYLQIPFWGDGSLVSLVSLTLSYSLAALPFVFSGITVAVALTKFPGYVNRLYAVDLVGAAVGCLVLVYALELAGGATSMIVVASTAATGAAVFAWPLDAPRLRGMAILAAISLGAFAVFHAPLERLNRPLLRITDSANQDPTRFHYVRWNSHSRVSVGGDATQPTAVSGWGLSRKTGASEARVRQLSMAIDTWAGTVITEFQGDLAPLWYLKDDVTNIAHYIRSGADVFVVGVGGGRDVLSALVFEQKSITGVEINRHVLEAIRGPFGEFSGYLHQHPKVTLVHDEARSFLAGSDQRFDIIQLSLIDTWAATAAGAFVLSESSLYTKEAWRIFLEHLEPGGVLSVSRWYYPKRPGEALRITALARAALDEIGVNNPREHVVLVKAPEAAGLPGELGNGVITILVSPNPFSSKDLDLLQQQVQRLGFELVATPNAAVSEEYEQILARADPSALYDSYPLDISPPTDDRPFFFQMLRVRDFARSLADNAFDPNRPNLNAIRLLGILLIIVFVLTLLCIVVPLWIGTRRKTLGENAPLLGFFVMIGLGFMFVEISQMQRLMILLGHPTYALLVVLFTLLVGTGLGSYGSVRVNPVSLPAVTGVFAFLIGVLIVFGIATPRMVEALAPSSTALRILSVAASLLVIGLLMGIPFPLGMRLASDRAPDLTPWLWGINGAASVLCTVLATVLALAIGISATFWTGVCCYALAFAAYALALPDARAHDATPRR